jgi:hypothetical protein
MRSFFNSIRRYQKAFSTLFDEHCLSGVGKILTLSPNQVHAAWQFVGFEFESMGLVG